MVLKFWTTIVESSLLIVAPVICTRETVVEVAIGGPNVATICVCAACTVGATAVRAATTVGAICVALLEGMEPEAALTFACAAGAIAATRPGAQPSMPTRDEVEAILEG